MKKIIFILLGFFIITGIVIPNTKWTDIMYHYQTGTIPPPYYYKYDLTINSAGFGTLVYYPDYSEMTSWVFALKFSEEDINKLDKLISESNLLNETIPSLPDSLHPIGGPLKSLTIVLEQDPNLDQAPPRIKTPYFPAEEYKEKINSIYEEIRNLVPQSTWDEIKTRKDEFIEKYKK